MFSLTTVPTISTTKLGRAANRYQLQVIICNPHLGDLLFGPPNGVSVMSTVQVPVPKIWPLSQNCSFFLFFFFSFSFLFPFPFLSLPFPLPFFFFPSFSFLLSPPLPPPSRKRLRKCPPECLRLLNSLLEIVLVFFFPGAIKHHNFMRKRVLWATKTQINNHFLLVIFFVPA